MIKYLYIFFIFAFLLIFVFIQKTVVFDKNTDFQVFGYNINFSTLIDNSYVDYFYDSDRELSYIFSNEIISKYSEHCHEEQQNCIFMPHQQTYSSYLWINSIQYVGTLFQSEYLHNLKSILDNLTSISPYWSYPYVFGQLVIPIDKNSIVSDEVKEGSWEDSISLGEKGIHYTCDGEIVDEVNSMSDDKFYDLIFSDEKDKYINPCLSYNLPYQLAFNYFYYFGDYESSANNYKLASFHDASPSASPSMVSIVQGRYGQHLQSLQLWFAQFLSYYENLEDSYDPAFEEESMDDALYNGILDLQFYLLTQANDNIGDEHHCYQDYDCLLNEGYLQDIILEYQNFCSQNYLELDLEKEIDDIESFSICYFLTYAINNSYINIDGTMFPSINPNFNFYWDNERFDSWRISG